MRKRLIKVLKLLLVAGCVITGFSVGHNNARAVDDDDFEANEEYYYDLCSGSGLTKDEKATCKLFRTYLADKQADLNKEMEELESSIADLKANITEQGQKIEAYNQQINSLDRQINAITRSITKIEGNIETLNQQILLREQKIEELNNEVKAAMVTYQTNLRTNSFVRFIMGATSFVDLLRRISAVNTIAVYTNGKIDEMNAEKALLQADMEELQNQKDSLIEQQNDLQVKQNSLEKLRTMTEELIDEFELQEAELLVKWEALDKYDEKLDAVIGDIDKALNQIVPSHGFGLFVHNQRIHINSACYYYNLTSGGFHAAIDVGNLGFTTKLYAIANGYVFATGTGCAYNGGYLGNTCNGGKGNYVFIMFEMENKFYCAYYEHLTDVLVKTGDVVYKDKTVVGTSGNSGHSSGPHLHFALYYLGDVGKTTMKELVNLYRTRGMRFGRAYNITGACSYTGNTPPCFMNPMEVYGYYWPNWYYVSY